MEGPLGTFSKDVVRVGAAELCAKKGEFFRTPFRLTHGERRKGQRRWSQRRAGCT